MRLKKKDRIVFYGDSITEMQVYTNAVESYLVSRYPGLELTFFNAGWSGDRAAGNPDNDQWGGMQRLKRDVLALKPTLVTLCYGMNDGGYIDRKPGWARQFDGPMRKMVKDIRAAGATPLLLTSGIVDESVNNEWMKAIGSGYNYGTLNIIKKTTLALAKEFGLPSFDLHRKMQKVQGLARRSQPGWSWTADGVHPDLAGGMIYAYGVLKALGVPKRHEVIRLDPSRAGDYTVPGAAIERALAGGGSYSWNIKLERLPYYVEKQARKVLPYLKFMEDFNSIKLAFKGLKEKNYRLTIGKVVREHSSRELMKGVLISDWWEAPHMKQAKKINDATKKKADKYRHHWRARALPDNFIQNPFDRDGKMKYKISEHKKGIAASLKMEKDRWVLLEPEPVRVSLRALG